MHQQRFVQAFHTCRMPAGAARSTDVLPLVTPISRGQCMAAQSSTQAATCSTWCALCAGGRQGTAAASLPRRCACVVCMPLCWHKLLQCCAAPLSGFPSSSRDAFLHRAVRVGLLLVGGLCVGQLDGKGQACAPTTFCASIPHVSHACRSRQKH